MNCMRQEIATKGYWILQGSQNLKSSNVFARTDADITEIQPGMIV